MPTPDQIAALLSLGVPGLLAAAVLGFVSGIIRPGKQVDRELAERDRRETMLVEERDEWRDRSLATDARLDRVVGAFERLAKVPAPD